MGHEVGFGVIGAGGFARFSVAQFVKQPRTRLVGVYDPSDDAITAFEDAFPATRIYEGVEQMLADPAVDLVYIGSPPFLHHQHGIAALKAGKHVICEKPAAIDLADAQELRAYAEEHDQLFVVNLMQRYNPLYEAVQQLIHTRILGRFLHGFFENYASDEALAPNHWFWDDTKSGGIFIEHGVHFFDMFEGWLGEGTVASAQRIARDGHPEIRDIAQCEVIYEGNAPVHFFHGFNQPKVLDRQQLRLQFERGDVTLEAWVPNRLLLHAVCMQAEIEQLGALFPAAAMTVLEEWDVPQEARGRFKPIEYTHEVRLDTGIVQPKLALYEDLVGAMFDDQLRWLDNRSHRRKVDARNAIRSLTVAVDADRMARGRAAISRANQG